MVAPNVVLRLCAVTVLLSGIAFAGSATAKSADVQPSQGSTKSTASVVQTTPISPPSSITVKVDQGSTASAGGCGRKVKVVYAGYGEADRASCSTSAKVAAE